MIDCNYCLRSAIGRRIRKQVRNIIAPVVAARCVLWNICGMHEEQIRSWWFFVQLCALGVARRVCEGYCQLVVIKLRLFVELQARLEWRHLLARLTFLVMRTGGVISCDDGLQEFRSRWDSSFPITVKENRVGGVRDMHGALLGLKLLWCLA